MASLDFSKHSNWENKKLAFIASVAQNLGMDVSGYGEFGVNPNSGYSYLWLEDYSFTLYMPISCELKKSEVWSLWDNSSGNDEEEMRLEEWTTLEDLENWVKGIEALEEIESDGKLEISSGVFIESRDNLIANQKDWDDDDLLKNEDFSKYPFWLTNDSGTVPEPLTKEEALEKIMGKE